METWKNELQKLIREMNFYPYKEWNKNLLDWCKEYAMEFDKLDGIYALVKLSQDYNKRGNIELAISIHNEKPFYIYLQYVSEYETCTPILKVSYTENYDVRKKYAKIFDNNFTNVLENEEEYYSWTHDCIHLSKEPALNQEFVMEYITIQFKKYNLK